MTVTVQTGRDRLRELLDVIVASLNEPGLTGGDVAGRAYLSRFHFDRVIAAATGEAPGALRRRLLLERAAYQLGSGATSVTAAALAAGYTSPEAFARAFRRTFGIQPSAHRGSRRPVSAMAPNGIHFHPPGGLRVPGNQRRYGMDVLASMVEHDVWLIGQMLDRAGRLDDEVLDRPITMSVDALGNNGSLRDMLTHLVWQKERWTAAVQGRPVPDPGVLSVAELARMHATSGPAFLAITRRALAEGRAGDSFIDATCEPPHTFSYGGMIAHVLNFAAHERSMVLGALETAGVTDLGLGDPSGYVTQGPPASAATE